MNEYVYRVSLKEGDKLQTHFGLFFYLDDVLNRLSKHSTNLSLPSLIELKKVLISYGFYENNYVSIIKEWIL